MPHKTKKQDQRLSKLKRNRRVKNPWALENWLETREKAKRNRRERRRKKGK